MMTRQVKYKKGTFLVIPNKQALIGMKPVKQTVFSWICSFANEDGVCFPSYRKLSQCCGVSVRTIQNTINELVEDKLLQKKCRQLKDKSYTSNEYQVLIKGAEDSEDIAIGVEHGLPEGSVNDARGVAHSLPTNCIQYELNPINSIAETSSANKFSPLGAQVLKAFENVDPKNKNYYNNKTQREACDFLIREYSLVEVLKRISVLPRTNKIEYFPTITSPIQLRDKWVQLQDAVERKRSEIKNVKKVAFT